MATSFDYLLFRYYHQTQVECMTEIQILDGPYLSLTGHGQANIWRGKPKIGCQTC